MYESNPDLRILGSGRFPRNTEWFEGHGRVLVECQFSWRSPGAWNPENIVLTMALWLDPNYHLA